MADEKKDKEKELDVNSVLADLNRQARDKELEALANLTLLRSSWGSKDAMSPHDQEQKSLDERLQKIIDDISKD